MNILPHTDDTIVALSTPPGTGAIAVIRLSGTGALKIISRLAKKSDLEKERGYSAHFVALMDGNTPLDEVIITLFRSPHSYTGEDVVEISCHGSSYIISRLLELCTRSGARLAAPGEFTQRAFLNGKMDLAQAEAVADLIASESRAAHQLALNQMRGGFSNELNALREKLIEFAGLLELELDFSEEDVAFVDRTAFLKFAARLKRKVKSLMDSFSLGNAIKKGISVAIIGKPNAGKSSLLNQLLGDERAIVSDIPGTTRDTIEEALNINGILFRLIDTAGIRDHSTDRIENLGMERSRLNAEKADIIINLIDLSNNEEPIGWLAQYNDKTIDIFNKAEIWINQLDKKGIAIQPDFNEFYINAKTGFNVKNVKKALYDKAIGERLSSGQVIVSNARHHAALGQIYQSLSDAETGFNTGISSELIALDIRRALYFLGEITGLVDVDRDVLGAIFGKFCIGK